MTAVPNTNLNIAEQVAAKRAAVVRALQTPRPDGTEHSVPALVEITGIRKDVLGIVLERLRTEHVVERLPVMVRGRPCGWRLTASAEAIERILAADPSPAPTDDPQRVDPAAHAQQLAEHAGQQAAAAEAGGYTAAVAAEAGAAAEPVLGAADDFDADVLRGEAAARCTLRQAAATIALEVEARGARIAASLERLRRLAGFRIEEVELKARTLRALADLLDPEIAELLEEIANDLEEVAS